MKTRNYLLELKVPLFQVAMLEDEIVTRIQKKKSFTDFPPIKGTIQLDDSAKDVLFSFIGSAAVKLLLG